VKTKTEPGHVHMPPSLLAATQALLASSSISERLSSSTPSPLSSISASPAIPLVLAPAVPVVLLACC